MVTTIFLVLICTMKNYIHCTDMGTDADEVEYTTVGVGELRITNTSNGNGNDKRMVRCERLSGVYRRQSSGSATPLLNCETKEFSSSVQGCMGGIVDKKIFQFYQKMKKEESRKERLALPLQMSLRNSKLLQRAISFYSPTFLLTTPSATFLESLRSTSISYHSTFTKVYKHSTSSPHTAADVSVQSLLTELGEVHTASVTVASIRSLFDDTQLEWAGAHTNWPSEICNTSWQLSN